MKLHSILSVTTSALLLSACCSSGKEVAMWDHLSTAGESLIVVYYPEHDTWNTVLMRATIEVDGEPVGKLCEGSFLEVSVEPGVHVLTTSRDQQSGCSGAVLRPQGGWPAVEVAVGAEPVVLRFGADDYEGAGKRASICYRHLKVVDEATARREAYLMDLIE